LALVGIAVLLLKEGADCRRLCEAILGGSLLVVSSFLWANQGAAAPMTLLALLAAAAIAGRPPWSAGVLAGLAVWIRPDAGVGVVILLILLLIEKRRIPWKTGLAATVVIALGLFAAWGWFASMLPDTLGAKIEMAQANPDAATGAEGFWRRGVIPLERHFGPAWLLLVALGVAGLWPFAQSMRRLGRLTALTGCIMAVLYPWLGVPFFSWYILLPIIVLLYGLPFCLVGLARSLTSSFPQRWASFSTAASTTLAAVLVVLLGGHALRTSLQSYQEFAPPARLTIYKQAAEWLQRNSQPNESVAYVEIGVLGYYSHRPIEDLMGLVTPRVLPFVGRNDLAGGFLTKPTDYVIFHSRGRMAPIVKASWFPAAYDEEVEFRDQGFRAGKLVIYRRRTTSPFVGMDVVTTRVQP